MPKVTFLRHAQSTANKSGIFAGRLDCNISQFLSGTFLPDGAESIDQTDRRVKAFIVDIFNKYSENDNILVVTHNGIIRSVKRLFHEKSIPLMSKNLDTFCINTNDFTKFQNYIEKNPK